MKTKQPHADYSTSAMETGDHFKNGASSKGRMSRRNFSKFLSIPILAVLLGGAIAFSSCKKDHKKDPYLCISEEYRGTFNYGGMYISAESPYRTIHIVIGETEVSWTGEETGSITGLYTSGGSLYNNGKWDYLYKNRSKIGFAMKDTEEIRFYIGMAAKDNKEYCEGKIGKTLDFAGITEYPSIFYD